MEDVSVAFDGFKAINNLNFYVNAGEMRCLIGPNGAGKTTMMDIITGRHDPTPAPAGSWIAHEPLADGRAEIAGRHRPQVPETDRFPRFL